MPPLIVQATITIATAIIAEASLSFLGLGLQPPNAVLGLDAQYGQELHDPGALDGRSSPASRHFPGGARASICWATVCATPSIRARRK